MVKSLKNYFNNLYSYLNGNSFINQNPGFHPGDSTVNQLLYPRGFRDPKSREVRAAFLDISITFDKIWHEGLIFKLNQNGISGTLLEFFQSYLQNRKQRVLHNAGLPELTFGKKVGSWIFTP